MTRYDVGINYWPARTGMRWWREFRADEFARDARKIAESGATSVRVFLLWEDFQPRPDRISDEALGHLVTVAGIADANGLSLIPTLFTGHMSGANWIPRWATETGEPGRFPIVCGDTYFADHLDQAADQFPHRFLGQRAAKANGRWDIWCE